MRKRYVQNSSRWILTAAVLSCLLALLAMSIITLPRLRSVPTSQTVAYLSTPTHVTQALAVYTPLPTQVAAIPPTATIVPPTSGVAIVVSDTAIPLPDETAQPFELLPDPDLEAAPSLPTATQPVQSDTPIIVPPVSEPLNPTIAVVPPTREIAPTKVIVGPAPTKAISNPPPTKAASKPSPTTVVVRLAPTKTPDPNLLPNGVRYGDHKPNLPSRIVRVASPNIKLDTPVYEVYVKSNKWEVAEYAAGHHYNSRNPGEGGNIVLNGHNNWKGEVFRYLENTKVGDLIQVWTQAGKEYDYRVTEIKKLKEAGMSMAQRLKNASVMDPTDHEQLTLITCWPYTTFTHRLIIIATPVK